MDPEEFTYYPKEAIKREEKMRNNLKKVSLFLSMVMLFVLASPLTVLAAEESTAASAKFYGTFWSLVPPLVAIALALITKEVYSSLFVGILVGALFLFLKLGF